MAGIELCRVGKRWGDDRHAVFTEFSLSVRDGEFLVLLGPSGCGKTTILRLIAGLDRPTSGTITIGGRDVTSLPPAERDVAMVFQSYALYPHLTVRENLSFPLRVRRVRRPELVTRVEDVASRLELSGVLERRPAELSGGQRQRVALGRAMVRAPRVFLLDEPLSNLDARLRVELRAELLRLHAALAVTMIYVTHDQVEAMTMGDRIAVLETGRLRQLGTPAEIYQQPADTFVARFVGSPGMNIVPAVLAEGPAGTCATSEVLSVSLRSLDYVGPGFLGVRPEHVQIGPPSNGLGDATVARREPLGAETLVHIDVRGQRLIARLSGIVDVEVGASVSYRIDPVHCHAFNGDGARLT